MSSIRVRIADVIGRDLALRLKPDGYRTAGDEIALLARAVGTAWSDCGRSWFERASTLSGAYEISCEQLLHFPAAIFALALGECEKATGHLRRAIERLPRGRPRFEEWGKRHGLIT